MGIVEVLTSLGQGIATMFVEVLQVLATVFFTISETGFEMTPLGYLALIGLVLAIVWRLFSWVRGLIRGSSR